MRQPYSQSSKIPDDQLEQSEIPKIQAYHTSQDILLTSNGVDCQGNITLMLKASHEMNDSEPEIGQLRYRKRITKGSALKLEPTNASYFFNYPETWQKIRKTRTLAVMTALEIQ